MSDSFRPLSRFEVSKLSREEMIDYYRDLREYVYLSGEKIKGIKIRQAINPVVLQFLKLQRFFNGRKLKVLGDQSSKKLNRPIIFAVTHVGRYDLEIACEVIGQQAHILCGDPETMYGNLDGALAELNGVVYVDTDSKTDRHVAKETSVKVLREGGNILIYPEGIWNLEPNRPVLPLFPGVIEMAYRSGATIIPVALEQYGKDFIANIGKNFEVSDYMTDGIYTKEKETEARDDLRDSMATLKWQIWESTGLGDRNYFPENYKEQYIDMRFNEWPVYTRETLKQRTFKEKGVTSPEDVYSFQKKLVPNKENAFLFRKH